MERKIEKRISELVDILTDDYKKDFGDSANMCFQYPEKEEIVEILSKLRKIIFPEYFQTTHSSSYK